MNLSRSYGEPPSFLHISPSSSPPPPPCRLPSPRSSFSSRTPSYAPNIDVFAILFRLPSTAAPLWLQFIVNTFSMPIGFAPTTCHSPAFSSLAAAAPFFPRYFASRPIASYSSTSSAHRPVHSVPPSSPFSIFPPSSHPSLPSYSIQTRFRRLGSFLPLSLLSILLY
ncbi:hypothetical protein MSAN_02286600 [Mycena sanguinolenta]|uniref:Uncharacterized protein n=1 Tax=Mycena sanguinolenta TaxID=230812 RepID=A0A8H6X9S0_9AGAR|nr:hypothetical protein MSAN_02286600 [Mycena sanguinolenta]